MTLNKQKKGCNHTLVSAAFVPGKQNLFSEFSNLGQDRLNEIV